MKSRTMRQLSDHPYKALNGQRMLRCKWNTVLSGLLFGAIFACSSAWAADGALEINQLCAEGDGCFPGDQPGFPVEILNSGSYILTSNLTVGEGSTGITNVRSDFSSVPNLDISLDLNGFTIRGPTACAFFPDHSCSPIGAQADIIENMGIAFYSIIPGTFMTIRIFNGAVRGMPNTGIVCDNGCTISNVNLTENALAGARITGTVDSCTASLNGGGDAGDGISVTGSIRNSYAIRNAGDGFSGRGVFFGNVAQNNGEYGINVTSSSAVSNNRLYENDTGLRCNPCNAFDNVITTNTRFGIDFANNQSAYGRNLIISNPMGTTTDTDFAVETDPNVCNGPCQ